MQKKRGRPVNAERARWQRTVGESWSERTFGTFWRALQTIESCDGRDGLIVAIQTATRPNGSLNVAVMKRCADIAVMRLVLRERSSLVN
jgi:hypothetical protein